MTRSSNDVAKCIYENTIQENEKRLREARIKSQGKGRARQDLNRLFRKLNQAVDEYSARNSEKLNLSCYNRNVTSCWYGPIPEFPPGSWWGIRMDCSRDGVHNPFNVDVHEGPFGAASVCTSHANMNEDVDLGDFLTLTGQVYHKEQPSADPLIHNYKNQIPLRLIRSYNLQNDIAPNTGYRYDGLYIVLGYWIGVNADGTKHNKFVLMRLADQGPPSWSNESSEVSLSARHTSARTNHPKPCASSNTYDLRKCSPNSDGACGKRKFNREALPVAKTIPSFDTRKSVPESSIVMRHVFKKPSHAESTTCSTSVPDRKTLTCLGTSATKTHSTNISIRMGLYESSHNVQETKKSVATMLHKPFKPIDIANRVALDIDARTPLKEDPKPVARTDADATTWVNPQVVENASCNGHVADEPTCPLSKRRKDDSCSHDVHPSNCSPYAASSPLSGHKNDANNSVFREHLRDTRQTANASMPVSSLASEPPKKSDATREKISTHHNAAKQSSELFHTQDIKSLESMTPDKILNLINREKHHPLSMMLIGNVIGLSTEECSMLNESKVTVADTTSKISHKQRDNAKENVACLSEDILNRRYCRYPRSKRLSWKVSKQADTGKLDKVLRRQSRNDVDQNCNSNARMKNPSDRSKENEYLSPFHVQSPLQAIAQHTRSAYAALDNIKTRLRADKSVLTKQDFPSSPMKKSRLNKKGDREIANLSIDANIGPKTRGPRNRRLRCINNTYTNKRCYSTLNTIMYSPGKRNRITEKQRYKSGFKRKSKPTKVARQPARDRQSKDRYRVSSTLRTRSSTTEDVNSTTKDESFETTKNTDTNDDRDYNGSNNVGNRKKESRSATINDTNDCNVPKTSFDRSLRKKLVQTIPLSRRTSQTSRLHYFRKKQQVEKPSTMDATTQCRLIFEDPIEGGLERNQQTEYTSSGRSADRRVKLQPESVLDVVCNDQGSQIYATTLRVATSAFTESDECHASSSASLRKKTSPLTEKSLKGRASAFVPVNTFDSDLRIARLRSIGFRPIIEPRSPFDKWIVQNERENQLVSLSKVTRRDVAEEYDKYTNEDNNVVIYMDDQLQYQDIEKEEEEEEEEEEDDDDDDDDDNDDNDDDDDGDKDERKNASVKDEEDKEEDVQSYVDNNALPEILMSLANIESPWHGWKQIVTNNRSYWIGW
ncbi:transcriptional regulator ATRX-like [Odontomachus brunneus]|uniref:transcriptional regulator ATRX-like n=1 Tax=Odontomachus brunneus TaxID=486640 RepID=UPI0013F1B5C2|nr:transcriptional regulator ATRX-like [Odontomachus brunneus]